LNSGFRDYYNPDYRIILFIDPKFKGSISNGIVTPALPKLMMLDSDMGRYLQMFKTTATE
jgi:hypothetical protein